MSYASNFDGSLHETPQARDAYDEKESLRLANRERAAFDDLSAEQIRELYNQGLQTREERAAEIREDRVAHVWMSSHPEYIANPRNGRQLEFYLRQKGYGQGTVNLDVLEDAYKTLREAGLLEVDEQKLKAQQRAEIEEEGAEFRRRKSSSSLPSRMRNISRNSGRKTYTETELYDMSLEELRQLALAGEDE